MKEIRKEPLNYREFMELHERNAEAGKFFPQMYLVHACAELDGDKEIDTDKSEWLYFDDEKEAFRYAEAIAQDMDAEYSDDDGRHGTNTVVVMKWSDAIEDFDFHETYYCGERFDEDYDDRSEAKHSEWYRRFSWNDQM